jgi:hypothetical protein
MYKKILAIFSVAFLASGVSNAVELSGGVTYEKTEGGSSEVELTVQADMDQFFGGVIVTSPSTGMSSNEYYVGMGADLLPNLSSSATYSRYSETASNMDEELTIGISTMIATLDVAAEYSFGQEDRLDVYEVGASKMLGGVTASYLYENGEGAFDDVHTIGLSKGLSNNMSVYVEQAYMDEDKTTLGIAVSF